MKKEYLKPHIKVSTLMYELSLLDGTPNRGIGGGVTNTGDGNNLPGTVGETGNGTDPYSDSEGNGKGQGTGGGGNRSKAYQVWEY